MGSRVRVPSAPQEGDAKCISFFVALGQRELANTHYTTAALLSSPRLLATPPHKVTLPALAQKSTFVNIFHPSYLVYILRAKYKRRTKDEPTYTLRTPNHQKVLFVKIAPSRHLSCFCQWSGKFPPFPPVTPESLEPPPSPSSPVARRCPVSRLPISSHH